MLGRKYNPAQASQSLDKLIQVHRQLQRIPAQRMQEPTQANTMQADTASANVDAALNATQAAKSDPSDPRLEVTAAQQTESSVGNLEAAQGNAILIDNPVQRDIQNGELISGTGVDAAKAAALTAQTQAAAALLTHQHKQWCKINLGH